ncbi:hypothetical protein Tco_0342636, partial [Tanacetum coccineum]
MNYQLVTVENKANKHAGPKEANHNAGTQDNIDVEQEILKWKLNLLKTTLYRQYGLLILQQSRAQKQRMKLKLLEKSLPKILRICFFKQELLEAAKTSSTNIVNTASTPVSTVSPYDGLSFSDLTNPDQDDSEIPALED